VFEFDQAEVFEEWRDVHGEAAPVALAQAVPPADLIVVRTRPGFQRAVLRGLRRAWTSADGDHWQLVSIANGPCAVRITNRSNGTISTIS
jgi:hypothetical protein